MSTTEPMSKPAGGPGAAAFGGGVFSPVMDPTTHCFYK